MGSFADALWSGFGRLHKWGARRPALYYTLPLAVWAIFIMVGSLSPPPPIPLVGRFDKLVHAGLYAVLGWLFLRAWVREERVTAGSVVLVWLIAAGWGLYLECLQGLTPHRTFDWLDAAANALGVAAGIGLWIGWRRSGSRVQGTGLI
jgi:VanZ family protein